MTSTELVTLKKVLSLEKSKGYKNTAVVGGLDRFLARWVEGRAADSLIEPLPEEYASLKAAQRRKWIENALAALETGASPPKKKASSPRARSSPKQEPSPEQSLASPVSVLPRVTPTVEGKLKRLGVHTIRDLLYLFPRRHNDFGQLLKVSELEIDAEQTVMVNVWEARETLLGGRIRATEAMAGDETGNLRVVWFNQPYLAKRFKPGTRLLISGRVSVFMGSKVMESPEYETLQEGEEPGNAGKQVPVYPLSEGLPQRTLRRIVNETLTKWRERIQDPYPEPMRRRVDVLELSQAILQAHYPADEAAKEEARRRLAFDELFAMQMYVFSRRRQWRESRGAVPLPTSQELLKSFFSRLSFSFTGAQMKALAEILEDMTLEKPMSRLLQGEVGSGKTVVALAALLTAVANDRQGAFMAPTEILAEQHYNTISRLLEGLSRTDNHGNLFSFLIEPFTRPIYVGLLIGSHSKKQRKEVQDLMAQGALDIVVGTHALAQQGVEIPRLALAVVDEQHRFGVMQRASLRQKGESPHLLVMSATPIPRSLALTLYGDLDISVLDELPPGRQKIKTRFVKPQQRQDAYDFLRGHVKEGRQAFVICPLIEESETLQTRAATTEFDRLSTDVFPDLSIGLLHGRMPLREKEEVMARFYRGEMDILVSTPVVEVGIDNPNASVILIEGAERFGLAQLHQFRGRVGRGEHSSFCLLLSDYPSAEARERLLVMERVDNGFAVAEEDLKFRGPGDFFGTRQSGLPDLRQARLSDQELLATARKEASALLSQDPLLERPEHRLIREALESQWPELVGEVS